jgi:hypothetical protein
MKEGQEFEFVSLCLFDFHWPIYILMMKSVGVLKSTEHVS